MAEDKTIKLRNRELLKFSKEALAYFIETSSVLYTSEQAIKDLALIDRYFKSLNRLSRSQVIQKRLADIDQEFLNSPNMSTRRRNQLMSEVRLIRRKQIRRK